jgi:hypothetical protein
MEREDREYGVYRTLFKKVEVAKGGGIENRKAKVKINTKK